MPQLTEEEYDRRGPPELRRLLDALDAAEPEGCEAELESDILTLEFTDGARHVINSHRAARQIWMAAERSAWHFDWDAESGTWIAHKTGDELWATVEAVLESKLGRPLPLKR